MNLTQNKIDSVLMNLSDMSSELSREHDEAGADTIDEAIQLITVLVSAHKMLDDIPEEVPEEQELAGDMVTLRGYCAEMKDLQLRLLAKKAEAAAIREPLDFLRLSKIPDLMDALEITTTTFAGIGRLQKASDIYAKTVDKDASFQYLRDTGYEDMIKPTVNASSLKALLRRMLKEGVELPECYVVTPFTRASIVKA